jgi:hypothetical protein
VSKPQDGWAVRLDLGHISGEEAGSFATEGEAIAQAHRSVDEGALSATVYAVFPGGMEIFVRRVDAGDPRPAFLLPLKETLRLRPSVLAERMFGARAVT